MVLADGRPLFAVEAKLADRPADGNLRYFIERVPAPSWEHEKSDVVSEIVLETRRMLSYSDPECRLYDWRTSGGAEVDMVVERGGKVLAACEVKSSRGISSADASGLRAFREDHPKVPLYIITDRPGPFELGGVTVLPFGEYAERFRRGGLF